MMTNTGIKILVIIPTNPNNKYIAEKGDLVVWLRLFFEK